MLEKHIQWLKCETVPQCAFCPMPIGGTVIGEARLSYPEIRWTDVTIRATVYLITGTIAIKFFPRHYPWAR
jgi:hypothetical protein